MTTPVQKFMADLANAKTVQTFMTNMTHTSTIQTFMANLGHAIRNHETVTIGGGQFGPVELGQVQRFMNQSLSKLMPSPGEARARQMLWNLPITDKGSAETFLRLLDVNLLAFHPDDDPASIVRPNGLPVFNEIEAEMLRQRMAEVHQHHGDPYSVFLREG